MEFIFELSWDPRGCLIRTTSQGRNQIFTFSLHSKSGIVIGIGNTKEVFLLSKFLVNYSFFNQWQKMSPSKGQI